jgi:glucose 1-dehydrogenase
MLKLDNKVALITGSDSGMGQAMAEEFAKAGANVPITFHTGRRALKRAGAGCRPQGDRSADRRSG